MLRRGRSILESVATRRWITHHCSGLGPRRSNHGSEGGSGAAPATEWFYVMRRRCVLLSRGMIRSTAVLSTLLCATTAVAWVCSYTGRWTMLQGPNAAYVLGISDGYLCLQHAPLSPDPAIRASGTWRWRWGTERECGLYAAANANQSLWACLGLIRTELRIPY